MLRTAFMAATALVTLPSIALAAGIERNAPSTRVLFEDGRYIEFSFSSVSPDLNGTGGLLDPTNGGTGDLFERFSTFGAAYKADLGNGLSYAFILSNSYGVDTNYPVIATSGYSGTSATLDGNELAAILAYDVNERVTVYGGARAQTIEAEAFFPFFGLLGTPPAPGVTYDVQAERDLGFGYLVGAAYQIPDIALRVALTYYSSIEHELDTVETITGSPLINSSVDIETPQSVNLEFQTGIAEDTLLFGSVRWVDWSEFAISPTAFSGIVGQPFVDYQEDWTTYTLGVGRRFNEQWSGAIQVSHEPAAGFLPLTTLGPVDGRTSLGLAATYTIDQVKITGGVTYAELGNTQNFAGTNFDDGDAIGFGFRVGYSF